MAAKFGKAEIDLPAIPCRKLLQYLQCTHSLIVAQFGPSILLDPTWNFFQHATAGYHDLFKHVIVDRNLLKYNCVRSATHRPETSALLLFKIIGKVSSLVVQRHVENFWIHHSMHWSSDVYKLFLVDERHSLAEKAKERVLELLLEKAE